MTVLLFSSSCRADFKLIAQHPESEQATITEAVVDFAATAYPAPSEVPTPTITPAPNAAGRFPPPSDVPFELETLSESAFGSLLEELQAMFNQRDATALSARIRPSPSSGMNQLGASMFSQDLSADRAAGLLASLFEQGSDPLIQGYFVGRHQKFGTACLRVVISGWAGDFPNEWIQSHDGPTGPMLPRHAGETMAWGICELEDGPWFWDQWSWSGRSAEALGYYDVVADSYHADTYLDRMRSEPNWNITYRVLGAP